MGLPLAPLTATQADPAFLWTAFDEWLLVSEQRSADELLESCREQLNGLSWLATDSSDALVGLQLSGTGARMLLAMGSAVDLGPEAFPPGRCIRTKFGKIAALIRSRVDEQFEMYVDRSVLTYAEAWLRRAATDPLITS